MAIGQRGEKRREMRRPTPLSCSSHQLTVRDPNHQRHHCPHDGNPQSLQPPAFVPSHVPTQQRHEETRHESHRPLADQERGMDALELLIQEMEERVTEGLVASRCFCNE
jgi:hypothetical protein